MLPRKHQAAHVMCQTGKKHQLTEIESRSESVISIESDTDRTDLIADGTYARNRIHSVELERLDALKALVIEAAVADPRCRWRVEGRVTNEILHGFVQGNRVIFTSTRLDEACAPGLDLQKRHWSVFLQVT